MQNIEIMINSAGRCIPTLLPLETHMSYPIPVRGENGPLALFLFCGAAVIYGQGIHLAPPSHVGFVNAGDGTFLELRPVRPADFGQSDPEGELLGSYKMRDGVSAEEFNASRDLLYRSYDILFPAFAANQAELSPEGKQPVREFKRSFQQVAEEPLLRYYHAAGRDFFAWLDKVS
jgi:hypothetical protein